MKKLYPKYPLIIRQQHLFADLGEGPTALVDTGCPSSFGSLPPGVANPEPPNLISGVRRYLGDDVRGLLGMDWLGRSDFEIDLRNGDSGTLSVQEGLSGHVRAEIPRTDCVIERTPYRAALDTGAQYGYVVGDLPGEDEHPVDATDYTLLNPAGVEFSCTLHKLKVECQGTTAVCRLSKSPDIVSRALSFYGIPVILGLDFFIGRRVRWHRHDGSVTVLGDGPAA